MDTLEKKLETTRTTTKLFRRFFGGRFEFENILPGEYIISVTLERALESKNVFILNKNLDLGVVKNEVEFPKYEIGDYTDSTRIYFKRGYRSSRARFNQYTPYCSWFGWKCKYRTN